MTPRISSPRIAPRAPPRRSFALPLRLSRIAPAAVALLAAACGKSAAPIQPAPPSASSQIQFDSPAIRAPITIDRDRPFLKVAIDGGGPFVFLLDTGAPISAVSSEVAERLGLRRRESSATVRDSVGEESRAPTIVIDLIQIGQAKIENILALSWPIESIPRLEDGTRIDGLLGFGHFRDRLLTIDYASEEIVVERGPLGDGFAADALPLPMIDELPALELNVEGTAIEALVDTGSVTFLRISSEDARRLPLREESVEIFGWGFGGKAVQGEARRVAGEMTLSGLRFDDPVIHFYGESTGKAHLGGPALAFFRLTFDAAGGLIRLAPSVAGPIRTAGHPALGVRFSHAHSADDPIRVTSIEPTSPAAESGLRVGDRVETIEGRPAYRMDSNAIEALCVGRESLLLVVRREDALVEIRAPVFDRLP